MQRSIQFETQGRSRAQQRLRSAVEEDVDSVTRPGYVDIVLLLLRHRDPSRPSSRMRRLMCVSSRFTRANEIQQRVERGHDHRDDTCGDEYHIQPRVRGCHRMVCRRLGEFVSRPRGTGDLLRQDDDERTGQHQRAPP